jgi:hypothetical protein
MFLSLSLRFMFTTSVLFACITATISYNGNGVIESNCNLLQQCTVNVHKFMCMWVIKKPVAGATYIKAHFKLNTVVGGSWIIRCKLPRVRSLYTMRMKEWTHRTFCTLQPHFNFFMFSLSCPIKQI